MTTSISLDQSKHLVQSFDELTCQAADLKNIEWQLFFYIFSNCF